MKRCFFALLLATCIGSACAQTGKPDYSPASVLIQVRDGAFVGAASKPIRFQGINIAKKDPAEGYVGDLGPADFALIHSWGMNAVRLCIFWDGLEPQPGQMNTAYLERIAKLVGYAKAEGLYVLLDMHQDLYSVKFGDGAPLWATLDDDKPHTAVSNWNDAYYVSADVQAALDHFWANSPAVDGVGLQEHYARAWQFVARRFRDEPAVLGYDLMNEPFPGQNAGRLEYAMVSRLADLLAVRSGQQHSPTADELLKMEGDAKGRRQILEWLDDPDVYRGMLEAGKPLMQEFDRDRLMPLYNRVERSIRQVDPRHILFIEPDMSANMGVETGITPLTDAGGRRDPQQAYAPHVYDLVVDTDSIDLLNTRRIEVTLERHQHFAQQARMPVLVGEWGAFYNNPAAAQATAVIKKRLTDLGFSDLYWAYRREMTTWKGLDTLKVKQQ